MTNEIAAILIFVRHRAAVVIGYVEEGFWCGGYHG